MRDQAVAFNALSRYPVQTRVTQHNPITPPQGDGAELPASGAAPCPRVAAPTFSQVGRKADGVSDFLPVVDAPNLDAVSAPSLAASLLSRAARLFGDDCFCIRVTDTRMPIPGRTYRGSHARRQVISIGDPSSKAIWYKDACGGSPRICYLSDWTRWLAKSGAELVA